MTRLHQSNAFMSSSDEQRNYITCSCQNCAGHIKFDPSLLRKGETRTVECPHCHLDTILYIPQANNDSAKIKNEQRMPQKHDLKEHESAVTTFELFVLRLTRFLTLTGAALVIIALAILTFVFIATFLPESAARPARIRSISYEEIAAALQNQANPLGTHIPSGSEINTAELIPEPVANFVGNHPDFNMDVTWMSPDQRSAFFNNLATIIQTTKTNHANDATLVQVVRRYVDIWTEENTPKPKAAPLVSKADIRTFCIAAAPALFGAMAVLGLILVLLAIERSIRLIAEKAPTSQSNPKKG